MHYIYLALYTSTTTNNDEDDRQLLPVLDQRPKSPNPIRETVTEMGKGTHNTQVSFASLALTGGFLSCTAQSLTFRRTFAIVSSIACRVGSCLVLVLGLNTIDTGVQWCDGGEKMRENGWQKVRVYISTDRLYPDRASRTAWIPPQGLGSLVTIGSGHTVPGRTTCWRGLSVRLSVCQSALQLRANRPIGPYISTPCAVDQAELLRLQGSLIPGSVCVTCVTCVCDCLKGAIEQEVCKPQ